MNTFLSGLLQSELLLAGLLLSELLPLRLFLCASVTIRSYFRSSLFFWDSILFHLRQHYTARHRTMPHNAVSVFNYAKHKDGEFGSIWAQSLAGGCVYEQFWSGSQYGGYWQMPLNYLLKAESIEFPAIGTTKERPVGTQMRHYLTSNGKP